MGSSRWLVVSLAVLLLAARAVRAEDPDKEVLGLDVEDEGDDDYEDMDEVRARLLVRKSYGEGDLVQGGNATFVVEVFNAGKSSAKGVEVKDSLPAGFELLEGTTSANIATIASQSVAKLSYTVLTKQAGVVALAPVSVKYTSEDDDTQLTGTSVAKRVYVLSTTDQLTKKALQVGAYATLGYMRTPEHWLSTGYVVAGVLAVVGAGYGYKSVSDANKRWRYQRALKEVEKMQ